MADGIAPPGVDHVGVMRPSIQKDLAVAVDVALVKDQQELGSLSEFPREGERPRVSVRGAVACDGFTIADGWVSGSATGRVINAGEVNVPVGGSGAHASPWRPGCRRH